MNDRDELPNWTSSPQEQLEPASNVVVQQAPRRGRAVVIGLLAIAVLFGMGALGYLLAQSQAESETAATEDVASDEDSAVDVTDDDAGLESAEAGSDADDALTVDIDDEADAEENADAEEDASADATDTSDEAAEGDENASARTAAFKGGKVYLRGEVPSQEVAEIIAAKAAAVVGPDNVVVEYEINPAVVIDPGESTPLIVEDVVLFQFNSSTIDPPFYPLLDLGTLLLRQNPQATVTVVTRTDAVGTEEINLRVAAERAQAVIDYWVAQGVSPDQVIADPRGEEGTSEDDDEQTAALQRRAEFIITGLLD